MPSTLPTHYAFSDESHHNIGQYRGIGLVTLPATRYGEFSSDLSRLLEESNISEFKWNELRTAKNRFAALKFIGWAIDKLIADSLRIDVLTWDTRDSRHNIQGRDDRANLERMYYHLFKNVLRKRWPEGAAWKLFPDEQSEINWEEMDKFLHWTSQSTVIQHSLGESGLKLRIKTEFSIRQISPCHSHEETLVQIADLLVGLAVYSRANYDCYRAWQAAEGRQEVLFEPQSEINITKADKERCLVLADLYHRCKQTGLRVSLKRQRGLRSLDPTRPINFWWYEPQAAQDKAPLRKYASPDERRSPRRKA